MVTRVSETGRPIQVGFSLFDQISYSDRRLPLGNVLSADRVRDLFAERDVLFGYGENDRWNTGLTLWSFIGQVLQDGKQSSCHAAVTHASRYLLEQGLPPPGPDTGEYCRARQKLDAAVLRQLAGDIAARMSRQNPAPWLWHGKKVKLVDGFTFTMPDTPENQAAFPQSNLQAPGIGFPIARACAVLSLADAGIQDAALGPFAGPGTGETALLRQVLGCFQPGEIMLADRYFCSFFMLALLKSRGVDGCMRLHQLRQVDPARVTWLGPNEYLDTWQRPQRAKWMSQEQYDSLPERLPIRIVTFKATTERQTEPLNVATTLLDHKKYPAAAIGQLYGYRWHVELDIFAIKQSLGLDHLRCKSPEMMRREFWATLLAYNLVRVVCAQAAWVYQKLPRQMSFTLACNTLLAQWLWPPRASIRQALGQHYLFQIASHEVGNRPGRIEPRVIKRRPKSYPLMTKPRNQYPHASP
jgi:hypothetical protein